MISAYWRKRELWKELTHKNKNGCFEACGDMTALEVGYDGSHLIDRGNGVDRLVTYEDTSLEPDEIL